MSRSRRKNPILPHAAAETDHPWKRAAARKQRRCVRQVLKATLDGDRFAGKRWEFENPCAGAKDGKGWIRDLEPRWMRK